MSSRPPVDSASFRAGGKRHLPRALAVFVVLALALAACSSGSTSTSAGKTSTSAGKGSSGFVVGWSPISAPIDPTRTTFNNGIEKPIEAMGGKIDYCQANNDPSTQAQCINSFITNHVNAIVIWPVDLTAAATAIKAANAAHIPVFSFFGWISASSGAKVVMSLVSPDIQGGLFDAQYLAKVLTQKYGSPRGTILAVSGVLSQTDGYARLLGLQEGLRPYPKIHVVVKDAQWAAATAVTIERQWLAAHPSTAAIWGATDCSYIPDPVFKTTGHYVKVGQPGWIAFTGMDACNQMLYDIRCGYQQQTVDLGYTVSPFLLGKLVGTYVTKHTLPSVGATIPTGNSVWPSANVTSVPGVAGPSLSVVPVVVTKQNVANPQLNGNKFLGPPDGISPACS